MQELMQALGVGQVAHSLYQIYNFGEEFEWPPATAVQRVRQTFTNMRARALKLAERLVVSTLVSLCIWALFEVVTRSAAGELEWAAMWQQLKSSSYE